MAGRDVRLFYAADIHGSEQCFRKWLNGASVVRADALVFGGDLAGKILQPIVETSGRYATEIYGEILEAETRTEKDALIERIRNAGRYDVIVSPEEKAILDTDPAAVKAAFLTAATATLARWMELADRRLSQLDIPVFMMLGNDDFPELATVLDAPGFVTQAEGHIHELPGGFELVSLGYSNPTPWNSPRELTEDQLATRLAELTTLVRDPSRVVLNVHVPPHRTHLDVAALLDDTLKPRIRSGQIETGNVGSTAVRDVVQQLQPLVSLHGHIHESPGMSKLGRTVAINPGSEYVDGILRAALITLDPRGRLRSWQLMQG